MSNRITHFEIPSDNPEHIMKFFNEVFGWNYVKFGSEPYWLAITGDEKSPGINGGIMKKSTHSNLLSIQLMLKIWMKQLVPLKKQVAK